MQEFIVFIFTLPFTIPLFLIFAGIFGITSSVIKVFFDEIVSSLFPKKISAKLRIVSSIVCVIIIVVIAGRTLTMFSGSSGGSYGNSNLDKNCEAITDTAVKAHKKH